jgi:hypothetical protein
MILISRAQYVEDSDVLPARTENFSGDIACVTTLRKFQARNKIMLNKKKTIARFRVESAPNVLSSAPNLVCTDTHKFCVAEMSHHINEQLRFNKEKKRGSTALN